MISALDAEGIDLLEISGGTYEAAKMFDQADSTRAREAFFLEFAELARQRTKTPLMVTGGFRSKRGMNDALASGAMDVVGIARPLAVEPDLPRRLLLGEATAAAPIARLARGESGGPRLCRWSGLLGYFRYASRERRALARADQAFTFATPSRSAASRNLSV